MSVLNRENAPPTTVSATGPAFGPWLGTVSKINNSIDDPNFNPFGSALAVTSQQQSDFSANGISFSGFVFIDYLAIVPPNNGGSATNRCYTTFHVAAPCDYVMQSTFTSNNVAETMGSVGLYQAGFQVFALTATGTRTGTLAVGDYELRILITGNSGGTTLAYDGRTQIDAVFSVPAPGSAAALLGAGALAARRRRRG